MLDKSNQMAAYRALVAAGGLQLPASISQSRAASGTSADLASKLLATIRATVTYPVSIAAMISAIATAGNNLNAWAAMASGHASLLSDNTDLSTLIELSIGWDVERRSHDLPSSEIPISLAISDTIITQALLDALNALDIAPVQQAMLSINTTLDVPAAAPDAPPVAPPSLSQAQINALNTAWTNLTGGLSASSTAAAALQTQSTTAANSVTTAKTAYRNAITTVLAGACANYPQTAAAVSALVPKNVLDLLKEGS